MGFFDFLFGHKAKKIQQFKDRDAVILDVRTKEEYANGAIPGSMHIPVQQVEDRVEELKRLDRPIITCCASGIRSGRAVKILEKHGVEATNGGGWLSLQKKL